MIKSFLIFLLLVLSGFDSYQVTLPNSLKINAEVAKNKQRGLMGRKSLCSTCGMIFIFEREGLHGFWMKDTLINLAILWIDRDGRIVYIVKNAEPCIGKQNPYTECKVYSSLSPAKYVLEINPEAAVGVEIGMKIKIEPSLF